MHGSPGQAERMVGRWSRNGAVMAMVTAIWLGAAASACAQSAPDTDNGRYTLSPVADGFLLQRHADAMVDDAGEVAIG